MSLLSRLRALNVFRPAPGERFSKVDLWVYRLFYWRWAPLLTAYPDLREKFLEQLSGFHRRRQVPLGRLQAVSTTVNPSGQVGEECGPEKA